MANGDNQQPTDPFSLQKPGAAPSLQNLAGSLAGLLNATMAGAKPGKYGKPEENSQIFMGKGKTELDKRQTAKAEGGYAPMTKVERGNIHRSYADVRLDPLTWDQATLTKFVNTGVLNKVKGFDVNMGMPDIMSAWDDMVQSSYAFNSGDPSNPRWTPWDVLETYSNPKGKYGTVRKGDWEYDVATGERVKYVGPLSKTHTTTNINKLTREDALALTKQSMSTMLGRDPNASEVSQYLAILNGYESEHPEVARTVTNIDPETGEERDSTTVRTGGSTAAGKQAMIEEQLKGTQEYGAFQAATTGMNWLMAMVNGGR